jgi:phospholipid/cholesterol/gamma-HCH transport system ATP-binding protein
MAEQIVRIDTAHIKKCSDCAIELKNVSKSFGSKHILKDLSFTAKKGETFAIIGPSGCGKSVTLKLMMGLLKADKGEIRLWDHEVSGLNEKEMAPFRKRMGMVFQGGALFDSLTVYENVSFALTMHDICGEEEKREKVKHGLSVVGLPGIEDKMPSELSGGMRKRVSLARAIVMEPEILLWDEPTTGLDPVMTAEIDRLIKEMQKQFNCTSIVVTHDLKSAYNVADRVGVHWEGNLVEVGTADEIQKSENPFVYQFVRGNLKGPMKTRG